MSEEIKSDSEKVVELIRDADGKIVGRTRLQKTAYLLSLAKLIDGFHFDYYHYGPYSEDLARAVSTAKAMKLITEKEQRTSWGGFYSTYTINNAAERIHSDSTRVKLARKATAAGSIALELAATAAYLAKNGETDPWRETEARKPDKAAEGRLEEAKALYSELQDIAPSLPRIY